MFSPVHYEAMSPDELTLVKLAASVGVVLQSRHPTRVILSNLDGHEEVCI